MIQKDTVVRYDTIRYTRLDLSKYTMQFTFPKVQTPELVYIEANTLDTIYCDNVQYVTYPREYFYTKTRDVEIWHSGISSRIDSLNVFARSEQIIQSTPKKSVKNCLAIGMEITHLNIVTTPIYFEYKRMLHKNIGIYGRLLYDIPTSQKGITLGIRAQIGW